MIRELVLCNFQSHADTELILSPHVNVIIGDSDSGKSNIVRALKWLLSNHMSGINFIRFGELSAYGMINFTDGNSVERLREETKNVCWVNDKEFASFGRTLPEEYMRAVNINFDIAFQQQQDPLFMLGQRTHVQEQINEAIGLSRIDKIFPIIRQELNEHTKNLSVYMSESRKKQRVIRSLLPVTSLKKELALIKERYQQCEDMQTEVNNVDYWYRMYVQLNIPTCSQKEFTKITRSLNRLESVQKQIEEEEQYVQTVEALYDTVISNQKEIDQTKREIQQAKAELKRIQPKTCPLCGQTWKG